MFSIKLISLFAILLISLASGFYPFYKKFKLTANNRDFPFGESLACGVFLGAGLIHMLGDANQQFSDRGYHYPFALLIAGIVFLILLLLEHIGREVYEHDGAASTGFVFLSVFLLAIHSFLEGTALGLSTKLTVFVLLLFAILAHKWAVSFALAIQINKSHVSLLMGILLFVIFATMSPLGILVGNVISSHDSSNQLLEPIFTALAAGTFIYLGTLHGLKQAIMIDKCCDLKRFSWVVFGFAIMAVVAVWT